MLTALVIFLLTVREPEWAAQMVQDSVRYGLEDKPAEAEKLAENADVAEPAAGAEPMEAAVPAQPEKKGLSHEEKKSMIFILLSIVLWFFGYNAVTSKYSVYASNILHKDYNLTLIIAQAAAIISYLPVGMIASKVGRKKTIRAGVIMLTVAFGVAAFLRDSSPSLLMNAMFALAGIAWATINVNSFPMVVEMCSESDVGRYTGLRRYLRDVPLMLHWGAALLRHLRVGLFFPAPKRDHRHLERGDCRLRRLDCRGDRPAHLLLPANAAAIFGPGHRGDRKSVV